MHLVCFEEDNVCLAWLAMATATVWTLADLNGSRSILLRCQTARQNVRIDGPGQCVSCHVIAM